MRVLRLSALIVLLDQLTKVWVRVSMNRYESIPLLGDVLKLTYTENPGMAFGLSLGSKLFLTLFSIVATALIGVYLWSVRRGPLGYRVALALILGGALGNIIDRVFYGVIWGYGDLFYGHVVDFIHLDVWHGPLPEWLPFVGGVSFALFPIGNIADLAIIGGVAAILIFQRRFQQEAVEEEAVPGGTGAEAANGAAPVLPSEPAAAPSEGEPPSV